MIKLFRNIRRNLSTENKFSKYLIYAFGEIVLVVIGILIALSINNWNEKRKNNLLGKKYINNLKEEVLSNYKETQNLIKWHEQKYKFGELVVKSLSEDEIISDHESLFVAVELSGWLYTPGYVQDVWNELYSTGNIKLIEDDSLRSNLSVLYRMMNQYIINSEEWNSYILGYRRIATLYIPASIRINFNRHTNNREYIGGFKDYPNMEILISNLRKHSDLQGYLGDMLMTNHGLKITYLEQQLILFEEIIIKLK